MRTFSFDSIFDDALEARVSMEKFEISGDDEELMWASIRGQNCGYKCFKNGDSIHQIPALLASNPKLVAEWKLGWKFAADGYEDY